MSSQNGSPSGEAGPSPWAAGGGYPADEIDLQQLFRVLRAQWLIVVGVLAVVAAAVGIYTFSQAPVYQSSSVVLVDVTNDARWSRGGMDELLSFSRGSRSLNNEIGILQHSLPLAERVAVRLLEDGHRGPLTGAEDGTNVPVEWLARSILFGSRVQFAPASQESDLIYITGTSTDPREAAAIANAYAEEYTARSRESSRAGAATTRAFIEEQEALQRRELEGIEAELQAFITREGALALDSEAESTVARLAALDAALEEARLELEIERTNLAAMEREVERVQPGLARRVGSGVEGEIRAIQEQVAGLELQASAFYAVNPELRGNEIAEPELARLTRQIASLRGRMQELSARYVDEVLAVGGVEAGGNGLGYVTRLQRDIVDARIRVQGLEARSTVLRGQQVAYESRMRDIPRQSIQLAQLQRQRQAVSDTYRYLVQKLQEARVAEQSQLGYVQVIRHADVPGGPVRPRKKLNMMVGLLLGLVGGVGAALLRATLDRRIRTPDDLREAGYVVLGSVPDLRPLMNSGDVKTLGGGGGRSMDRGVALGLEPYSPMTEAMRHLRTSIRYSKPDADLQVIQVTSASPSEGKTTVAVSLAISLANVGRRTLLVDCDLRQPRVHAALNLPSGRGLTELVFEKTAINWDPFRVPLEMEWEGQRDLIDRLFVLPAGRAVPNPTELLQSQRLQDLFARMRADFDVVVVDTPPVLPVVDPLAVAALADGVVLVVRAHQTNGPDMEEAAELIARTGTPLLGAVLNGHNGRRKGYGYGYGHGYAPSAVAARSSGDGAVVVTGDL